MENTGFSLRLERAPPHHNFTGNLFENQLLLQSSPKASLKTFCQRILSSAGKESLEEKIITRKYSILIGIWYAYKKINPQYVALRKNSCGNEK